MDHEVTVQPYGIELARFSSSHDTRCFDTYSEFLRLLPS